MICIMFVLIKYKYLLMLTALLATHHWWSKVQLALVQHQQYAPSFNCVIYNTEANTDQIIQIVKYCYVNKIL